MNNSIAGLANFTFNIGNMLLLIHINFDILIKLVIFFIMSVITLFFIGLTNMDKFSVFFNNIKNELVYDKFVHSVVCR